MRYDYNVDCIKKYNNRNSTNTNLLYTIKLIINENPHLFRTIQEYGYVYKVSRNLI